MCRLHYQYLLQAQLREIGEQKEREMTELDEHIAQLKDQLQETKQRVALEGKYIKKEASVRVSVVQKRYKQQATALAARRANLSKPQQARASQPFALGADFAFGLLFCLKEETFRMGQSRFNFHFLKSFL